MSEITLGGVVAAIATLAQPARAGQTLFRGGAAGEARRVDAIDLCWCPPGRFVMGSPRSEPERRPGEDQVEVTLTRGFWMAKYETTQGLWQWVAAVLPGPLAKELLAGDDLPVGNVNFARRKTSVADSPNAFARAASFPAIGNSVCPPRRKWEYACRAGTSTAASFGDSLSSKQANFKGKPYNGGEPGPSLNRATPVGSYPANAWGLHNMRGNTYEWCRDWYHSRLSGGIDPDLYAARATAQRSEHGDISRVRRGGCWSDGWPCRSAFRVRFEPERRYDHIGFRVVAVHV